MHISQSCKYHIYALFKFCKDERAAGIIPGLLNHIEGKEITALIGVKKGKNEEDDYIIYAEDIYEFQTAETSNTESSPLPEYPSIDLTEVSFLFHM